MRQLSCMSTDVYHQKLINWSYTETSYLYLNGKKGKQARCQRDRERETERERESERWRVAENRVGVRWGVTNYFRII